MWGEELADEMDEKNTPFYDEEMTKKLTEQREAKMAYMLE